jgi:hypothetical protein
MIGIHTFKPLYFNGLIAVFILTGLVAQAADFEPVLGKWKVITKMPTGDSESMMEFSLDEDGSLNGVGSGRAGSLTLNDVTFDGNTLSWKLNIQGNIIPVSVEVDGDTFAGAANTPLGNLPVTGSRFNEDEADAAYTRLEGLVGDWEVMSEYKGKHIETKMRIYKDDDGDIEGMFVMLGSRTTINKFELEGDQLKWDVGMPLLATQPVEANATLNESGSYFEGVVKSPAGDIPIRGNQVDTTKLVIAPYDDPAMILGSWTVLTTVGENVEYHSTITFEDTPERLAATIEAEGTVYEANQVEFNIVNEERGMASARIYVDIPELQPETLVFEMIVHGDSFDGEELYSNGAILISGERAN